MNTKIIKLDINRRLYDKIVAKQDDTKSRFLLFQLLDGAVPFNLTDRSVRVYGVKPDGAVIFNDLTVTHSTTGFCLLELTNQMLAIAGTVKLELMITEGDKKLTSIPFEMEVIKKINSNAAVESSNEFRSLLNALKEIDEWNKEFADKSGKLEELYTPRLNELGSQLETIVQQTDYEISDLKQKMKNYIRTNNLNSYFGKQIVSSAKSLAFPSIAKFNNKLYVAFREGTTHTSIDGVIKIRTSTDEGKTWSSESQIVLSSDGRDYRDPQLIVFNNKLVLRAFYRMNTSTRHIVFKVSEDGEVWESGIQVAPPSGFSYAGASGTMIERNGTLISTAYTYPHTCSVFVITTTDLVNFNTKLVLDAEREGFGASESTIDYLQGKYRIFCRPSPEDSMDWFVIRTDDDFNLENIQVKSGTLDGPRSLSINEYNCLLTYRDNNDQRNQKIVITKTDRNGNEYKNILLEHENSTDSGYYDLKLDGDNVYGVFYRKDESNNYNIHFRLYSYNELINLDVNTKNIVDTSTGKKYIGKILKGNKTYTHNVDVKDFVINIPTTNQVTKILNITLTVRTDDVNNVFVVNLTNVTINVDNIDLSVRVLNPKSATNNARNTIYYDVTYI